MKSTPPARLQADAKDAEAALIARLKAGEEAAFEELVRRHGPRMYAVARRYLPQEADAQDALQEALLCAYRGIGTFAGGSRLDTWLYRVTVNSSLMRIRSRSRRRESAADPDAIEAAAARSRGGRLALSASEAVSRDELRERVRRSIGRVPETYRTVLMLRDVEGVELKEIGRLLGIGVSTVKIRLHRGRHALRDLLATTVQETRS